MHQAEKRLWAATGYAVGLLITYGHPNAAAELEQALRAFAAENDERTPYIRARGERYP